MTTNSYQRIAATCSITASVLLEFTVRKWDLWLTIPQCDKIMHFLWGLNIFLILSGFLKWQPKAAVTGVLAWQLLWEYSEMIGDHLLPNQPSYMLDHFYHDGIIDTVTDLAGAMLGCLIVNRMRGIRGTKRVFPTGSLRLLLGCFTGTALLGPVVAVPLAWNMNHFAIACILLTMITYLTFLLHVNRRIRIPVPARWAGSCRNPSAPTSNLTAGFLPAEDPPDSPCGVLRDQGLRV